MTTMQSVIAVGLVLAVISLLEVVQAGLLRLETAIYGGAVATNVDVKKLDVKSDSFELMIEWDNVRNCEFTALTTVQGSDAFPDELRTPLDRNLGPPKGPRGIGRQKTLKPWVFHRPKEIHSPDFIMVAWHRCGERSVPSKMLVLPMSKVFPKREAAPNKGS